MAIHRHLVGIWSRNCHCLGCTMKAICFVPIIAWNAGKRLCTPYRRDTPPTPDLKPKRSDDPYATSYYLSPSIRADHTRGCQAVRRNYSMLSVWHTADSPSHHVLVINPAKDAAASRIAPRTHGEHEIMEMESNPIREEVETFMRACQTLAAFRHHHPLTEKERMAVVSFVRALELELGPPIPLLSPDDPPIAAAISNSPPID